MSCMVRGVLRNGEKVGGSKKRVHFSDEGLADACAAVAPEYERVGVAATTCRFEEKGAGLVEVFAKASIAPDANLCTAVGFSQLGAAANGEGNSCLTEEEMRCSAKVLEKAGGVKELISCNNPSTPPSCARYGLATWDSDNCNAQAKRVQRKLTFVVGAGDRVNRKYGYTSKKTLSKAQNYKVVPESQAAFSVDFLTPHSSVMHAFGFPEGSCKKRCAWITPHSDAVYVAYHDKEWGVPVHEDRRLFELLVFASAQSEIAWSLILTKREAYRDAFAQFDPAILATYDDMAKMTLIKSQRDILKSEARVQSIVSNAKVVMKIVDEFGSFNEYLWKFVSYKPIVSNYKQGKSIPMRTAKSEAISKDLQRRGMRHIGPMVIYSFMQAAGLANDHLISCFCHLSNCKSTSTSSPSSSLLSAPPTKSLIAALCC